MSLYKLLIYLSTFLLAFSINFIWRILQPVTQQKPVTINKTIINNLIMYKDSLLGSKNSIKSVNGNMSNCFELWPPYPAI